jgi:hypothetical protein
MTDSFGTSGDSGQDEGNNTFGDTTGTTNAGTDHSGIDPVQYEELRKRDEHAQQHIPRLESENNELRDKVVELEKQLANSTTLDEALAGMQNQGSDQASIDRTDVAQIVTEVLGQHQTQATQESNWQTVAQSLTDTYGDWETADKKVLERATELDISVQDATAMARQNPKAFMQLFVPQGQSTSSAKPGSSTGTGEIGQRGAVNEVGETRNKDWWNNLRRTNPDKYWSVEMQAMMRRDLFSD